MTGATAAMPGLSTTQFVMLAEYAYSMSSQTILRIYSCTCTGSRFSFWRCSAQRQKAALAEQQVQYQELLQENRQLQEQLDNSLKDNFEVTEFLRREIISKDDKISSLQAKMEEVISRAVLAVQPTLFLYQICLCNSVYPSHSICNLNTSQLPALIVHIVAGEQGCSSTSSCS